MVAKIGLQIHLVADIFIIWALNENHETNSIKGFIM